MRPLACAPQNIVLCINCVEVNFVNMSTCPSSTQGLVCARGRELSLSFSILESVEIFCIFLGFQASDWLAVGCRAGGAGDGAHGGEGSLQGGLREAGGGAGRLREGARPPPGAPGLRPVCTHITGSVFPFWACQGGLFHQNRDPKVDCLEGSRPLGRSVKELAPHLNAARQVFQFWLASYTACLNIPSSLIVNLVNFVEKLVLHSVYLDAAQ